MKKLIIVLLGLTSLNISAHDVTQGPLQQHPALCQYGYNPNCGSRYAPPPPPAEPIVIYHPPKYGALAYNAKTGHIAGSLNQDSKAEAEQVAIDFCRKGSRDKNCEVIRWARNGCVAAAEGRLRNRIWVTNGGGAVGEAEPMALDRCRKIGAKGCKIIMPEGCSLPY